jgi:hypothetical protein
MNSARVRSTLLEAVRLDLVGPGNGSELEGELLNQPPSRWYLTGFLVPLEAAESRRVDETADDDIDGAAEEAGGTDDAAEVEKPAARRPLLPSSMGLSLLVSPETKQLHVTVGWGDYALEPHADAARPASADPADKRKAPPPQPGRGPMNWRRTPREAPMTVPLVSKSVPIAGGGDGKSGLEPAVLVRPVQAVGIAQGMVPAGTRSVSISLVNHRRPAPDEVRDTRFAFQARLEVESPEPLVARPNVCGRDDGEWDERVGDLPYRDVYEYAVGHGVATHATVPDGKCHTVRTCWIPDAEVELIAPSGMGSCCTRVRRIPRGRWAASSRPAVISHGT